MDADVKATCLAALNTARRVCFSNIPANDEQEAARLLGEIDKIDVTIARIENNALDVDAQGQGWLPVSYDDIFTAKGEPLRSDYKVLCEKWLDFNNVASDTKDGYEYAVCRLAPHAPVVSEGLWLPVTEVVNDQDSLHADSIAVSIGTNDVCMGLFEWPEDGNEYAVCKYIPSTAMSFRKLYDVLLIAHEMAMGNYIQSDTVMRQRIAKLLGDTIKKCGVAMADPNSTWDATQTQEGES